MNNIFEAAQLLESEGFQRLSTQDSGRQMMNLYLNQPGKLIKKLYRCYSEGGFGAYVTGLINNARIGAYTKVIGLRIRVLTRKNRADIQEIRT